MAQFHSTGSGFKSSANAATRGRGGYSSRPRGPPRHKGKQGGGGSSNSGSRGGRPNFTNNRGRRDGGGGSGSSGRSRPDVVRCQICGKPGQTAEDCWYRFDEDDASSKDDDKVVAAAEGSYGVDTNWYLDSGATNHLTGELEKVTLHEKYHEKDQIHIASGAGMSICHIGHSVIRTPSRKIHLHKKIHVPSAKKIFYLFIALPLTIMSLLNSILFSF